MRELGFVLLTPESVQRQLAGVALSRLMARGLLELEAAQLLNLTGSDASRLAAALPEAANAELANGLASLLYIFSGEDCVRKLNTLTASLRMCFGSGRQPLALAAADTAAARAGLAALAEIADRPNLLTPAPKPGLERTLLIVKPENWRAPSVRPGAILDMLMGLELDWVGCKVHGMSIDEALDFYGPVRQALRSKLGPKMGGKAVTLLQSEFHLEFSDADAAALTLAAGNGFADDQFEQIVEFMAGKRPAAVPEAERGNPAGAKCLVLIFDGIDAVAKIRTILGPTDPAKAPGGTVRYDFGTNVMVNASHASDSRESFEREGRIVRVDENQLSRLVRAALR